MGVFLKLGAHVAAGLAVLVGLISFSSIPTKLGMYRWTASRDPSMVGMTPAHSYGVPWKFTFEELYGLDLTGQRAVVIGANSGVGYATAEALAVLGADVILACRSAERCDAAATKIRAKAETRGAVSTLLVDTGSLASVRDFGMAFVAKNGGKPLHMLFLNAGYIYMSTDKALQRCPPANSDGIETTFATNYVGHHLVYRWLEPALLKSKIARVVSTTSAASFKSYSYQVATDLQTLNGCSEPDPMLLSYGQSKLAQIVWTKYVTRRLSAANVSNVYVSAFHPGAVATDIWAKTFAMAATPQFVTKFVDWLQREAMWTSAEGALTGLYLGAAVGRVVQDDVRGKYFHPQAVEATNPAANNEALQNKLWNFSEELVQNYLPKGVASEMNEEAIASE